MLSVFIHPVGELNRAQRAVRYMWDLGRFTYRQLCLDRAGTAASALTYHTLFSLLPTLVLMLVVMKVFVSADQMVTFRDSSVVWMLEWLEVEDPGRQAAAAADSGEEAAEENARAAEFRQAKTALSEQLGAMLEQLQQIDVRSIGIVGVLLFIYGATRLLTSIELSFNHIYQAPYARAIYMRLPLYYTSITLGPLVLMAGQYAQHQFIETLRAESLTAFLAGPMVVLTPLVTMWLVLLAAYVLLPNTRVHVRPAAIGAFAASIGIVAVVELFGVYVRHTGFSSLYGALALLPLFLYWLWLLWMVVLFGLELAYTLQAFPNFREEDARETQGHEMNVDPAWLIPLVSCLSEGFHAGETRTAPQIAKRLGLQTREIRELCELLREHHFLHHVIDADGDAQTRETGYTLARPPQQIAVNDLLALGKGYHTLDAPAADLPGAEMLQQLAAAKHNALDGRTFDKPASE